MRGSQQSSRVRYEASVALAAQLLVNVSTIGRREREPCSASPELVLTWALDARSARSESALILDAVRLEKKAAHLCGYALGIRKVVCPV